MAPKGGISTSSFSVDKASWLEQLLEMMASRDSSGNLLPVTLPDTVAFRYQRPAGLYYTEDGVVRVIDENAELNAEALLNRFSKGGSIAGDELCALYIYRDRQAADDDKDTADYVIEYMNTAQLHNFLNMRVKDNNGILQRFVPGRSTNNTCIRVKWTPRSFVAESCTNKHRLDDTRVAMPDKACTFDGQAHLIQTHDITKGMIAVKIKDAVAKLICHVESLLPKGYHVWEAVMYWKLCAAVKGSGEETAGLNFQWCSCIRLYRDEVLDLNKIDAFWSSNIQSDRVVSKPAPKRKKDMTYCPVSGEVLSQEKQIKVMASGIVAYMRFLSRLPAPSAEVVKYMHEAVDIQEQARYDEVFSSKTREQTRKEEIKEIDDAVARLMTPDSKRHPSPAMASAAVDKAVIDVIKRAMFATGSKPEELKRLGAIMNHPQFVAREVSISEEVALRVASSAMKAVEQDPLLLAKPSGGTSVQGSISRPQTGGGRSRPPSARPGSASMNHVVQVKSVNVLGNKRGGSPSSRPQSARPHTPLAQGWEGADNAFGSRILSLRRAQYTVPNAQPSRGGSPAGRVRSTSTAARSRSSSPMRGGSGEAVQDGVSKGGRSLSTARPGSREVGGGGGMRGASAGGQRSGDVVHFGGGGVARDAVRPSSGYHASDQRHQRQQHKGRAETAKGLSGGGGGESDEGGGDLVDGELIVDDEDDEDWDDGLELDLPSTQKKLKLKGVKPAAPLGPGTLRRMFRGAGGGGAGGVWALTQAKDSKNAPLFAQFGKRDMIRNKVLSQYKAFSQADAPIHVSGHATPQSNQRFNTMRRNSQMTTPGIVWGNSSPPRGFVRPPLKGGGETFKWKNWGGGDRGGSPPTTPLGSRYPKVSNEGRAPLVSHDMPRPGRRDSINSWSSIIDLHDDA